MVNKTQAGIEKNCGWRNGYPADQAGCLIENGRCIRCGKTQDGTRLTEPGKGATIEKLRASVEAKFTAQNNGAPTAVLNNLWNLQNAHSSSGVTNLALTGAPLTAADLARIEKAKVGR